MELDEAIVFNLSAHHLTITDLEQDIIIPIDKIDRYVFSYTTNKFILYLANGAILDFDLNKILDIKKLQHQIISK